MGEGVPGKNLYLQFVSEEPVITEQGSATDTSVVMFVDSVLMSISISEGIPSIQCLVRVEDYECKHQQGDLARRKYIPVTRLISISLVSHRRGVETMASRYHEVQLGKHVTSELQLVLQLLSPESWQGPGSASKKVHLHSLTARRGHLSAILIPREDVFF